MKKLSLGFSPCPNDTFIFYAMLKNKVDTEGLTFETIIKDVEELNQKAFNTELDITKLSYHAYSYLINNYVLLDAGSALGYKCGPLLISKRLYPLTEINDLKIAIPGKYTTANFLFSMAFPNATNKTTMLFSDIEEALAENKVDAGLIIHENRFTYQNKGLKKIIDLGDYWGKKTGLPIPLGGIIMKRNLPTEIQLKVNRILKRSVKYALANPDNTKAFVKKYSQEMDESIIYKHINLYVNDYTVNLGKNGRDAINTMFNIGRREGIIQNTGTNIYLT